MNIKRFGASLLMAGAFVMQSTAYADVTGGNSKGYGIFVALELVGVPILTVPEQPVSQGTAPGPYSDADQILSLFASTPSIGSVGTGVMNTTADSDIDGGAGVRFAMSSALVDDLAITLVPGTTVPSLLTLTADSVGSDSIVSGDFGSIPGVGTSVFENLLVNVSGIAMSVPLLPAPNTMLWDSLGLSIMLNEQIFTGAEGSASMITNAIHIQLDDVVTGSGLLSGDIIVAHSDAQMTSIVPEPATFIGLGGALGLFTLLRVRRGCR